MRNFMKDVIDVIPNLTSKRDSEGSATGLEGYTYEYYIDFYLTSEEYHSDVDLTSTDNFHLRLDVDRIPPQIRISNGMMGLAEFPKCLKNIVDYIENVIGSDKVKNDKLHSKYLIVLDSYDPNDEVIKKLFRLNVEGYKKFLVTKKFGL